MQEKNQAASKKGGRGKRRGLVGAAGLSAAGLLAAPQASEAAQEISQLAADTRPFALLLVLGPAVGWVLFNILQPAFNQLGDMQEKNQAAAKKGSKRR